MGGGVSACAVCDGFFLEIKRLLSWELEIQLVRKHITYLNFVKVTMLVRGEKFRAQKIMEARVRKTENITILMNHDTVEVLGDEQVVTGVKR
jgi:thioredoxin reductase (NADPH)